MAAGDILKIVKDIKEPLSLAALAVAVTYLLFDRIVRQRRNPGNPNLIARYLFIIVLVVAVGSLTAHILPMVMPQPLQLVGNVHDESDPTQGIPAAVYLRLGGTRSTTTDSNGDFNFKLSRADLNSQALVWAKPTANSSEYSPSDQIPVRLYEPIPALDLHLKKLQAVNTTPPLQPAAANPAKANPPPVHPTHSSIPSHFYFMYAFQPPGRRDWTRVSESHWIETYPDGKFTPFSKTGNAEIDGCHGTVVSNDSDASFEVFIPNNDKDCSLKWTRFRVGNGQWAYLGEMRDVE